MAAIIGGVGGGTDGLLKSMDANRYATKKTIAQGMLDIALLTANASQLKYILQVGQRHEFYTLMLTLISISICLQIAQCLVAIFLGSVNINKEMHHNKANLAQNIVLGLNAITVCANIVINSLEVKTMSSPELIADKKI